MGTSGGNRQVQMRARMNAEKAGGGGGKHKKHGAKRDSHATTTTTTASGSDASEGELVRSVQHDLAMLMDQMVRRNLLCSASCAQHV